MCLEEDEETRAEEELRNKKYSNFEGWRLNFPFSPIARPFPVSAASTHALVYTFQSASCIKGGAFTRVFFFSRFGTVGDKILYFNFNEILIEFVDEKLFENILALLLLLQLQHVSEVIGSLEKKIWTPCGPAAVYANRRINIIIVRLFYVLIIILNQKRASCA